MRKLKQLLSKLGNIFKSEPPVREKTPQELELEELKKSYRLESFPGSTVYHVQYLQNGKWWYLRKWDEDDYVLEASRAYAIRISNRDHLDSVILQHQKWIKGGRFFLASEL